MKSRDVPILCRSLTGGRAHSPALRKFVEVSNLSDKPHRLLNVRLGSYHTDAKTSDGEQGFPVYLNSDFFMSLAHPPGWAIGNDGAVRLRHYPGTVIASGKSFACMETMLGVCAGRWGQEGIRGLRSRADAPAWFAGMSARTAFSAISARGRCMAAPISAAGLTQQRRRRHAQPGPAGREPEGDRPDFRLFDMEFWFDLRSEMDRFNPTDFPHGLMAIYKKLDELGIKPGLWMASTASPWCSMNPKFAGCCSVEEPFRSAFIKAHRDHIRDEGVRMFKFDCLSADVQ